MPRLTDARRGPFGSDRLTIVFFPEGAFAPTNNCVGIGNVFRARGHRARHHPRREQHGHRALPLREADDRAPAVLGQYDNAQRVDELGFGVRLPTYAFDDVELTGAIDRLLAAEGLHARLADISARLGADPGTVKAADLIEQLARTKEPVTH